MSNIKYLNTEYTFKVTHQSNVLYQRPVSFFGWLAGRERQEVELVNLELETVDLIPDIEPGDLLILYPPNRKLMTSYYHVEQVQEYLDGRQKVFVQAYTDSKSVIEEEMKGLIIQHPAL